VAEDEVLQQLLAKGLAWDEIEEEFGPRFAEDFAVTTDVLVKKPESYSSIGEKLETQKVFSVVKVAC
jgi:hypothetical protein